MASYVRTSTSSLGSNGYHPQSNDGAQLGKEEVRMEAFSDLFTSGINGSRPSPAGDLLLMIFP